MTTGTPVEDRDVDAVRASGLFDAPFYLENNPDVAESGVDPLVHFCTVGWLELRRPRADFDVWWYWVTHLDPGSEDLNPFVHWVNEGRAAGLAGLPSTTTPAPEADTVAAPAGSVRRICLFAAYDRDSRVGDHLVRYVTELSRHADVYLLHDGHLPAAELSKLAGSTRGAWGIRHGAYDFGSWSLLAGELVGWDVVASYDELLLVNDSCYLLRPLDDVFATMDATPCDWWGLQATKGLAKTRDSASNGFEAPIPMSAVQDGLLDSFETDPVYDFHVGSYFVAYRRRVLDEPRFRAVIDSVSPQRGKLAVILKYEIGLTHFLVGNGYGFATYAEDLYPFHPLFSEWHFTLLERGFPLLKKYFLYQNHYDVPGLAAWKERVRTIVPEAPVDLFEADLLRTAPHDRLTRSFAVERADDGTVLVPRVLSGREFRRADEATPAAEHVWAFPVDPGLHTLPASSRLLVHELRHHPEVKAVVLTRSRSVSGLPGHATTAPLASPEGQSALMGAGYVFCPGMPRRTVGERLSPDHRVVVVRDGMTLRTDRPPALRPRVLDGAPGRPVHAVLTASDLDHLVAIATHHPTLYSQGWRTGLPAHDALVAPLETLPPDLFEEWRRLERELAGRRLVLLAPAFPWPGQRPYEVSDDELARLATWCASADVVLGVREDPRDLETPWLRRLEPVAVDLSHHRYGSTQVVLRAADVVVTDYSGLALDAAVTGRRVACLAPDLASLAAGLVVDLPQVLPGPVVATLDALVDVLEHEDGSYDQRRRLLGPTPDGGATARVVAHVLSEVTA